MLNVKNKLSLFKKNVKNKLQNGVQKFKKNFSKAKSKPISKRKSVLLGFTTILGIFGVTLFASVLPAVAKDLPKNGPKPDKMCPSPTPQRALMPSEKIISGLTGAAATICGLAISSGSFMIGAACGVIVVIGILKAQGK